MMKSTNCSIAPVRDKVYDYDALPALGRLSLRLSNRLIESGLKSGDWLDLLCGYRALLQRSHHRNSAISGFYCLDHTLDPDLSEYGFHLTESAIDKMLPYESETFENITIVNGLEHLWEPQQVLEECHRTLKIGGMLQIIVPTWFAKPVLEFLAFTVKNQQAYLEINDHKMYYDEKTLWPMLVRAGFQPSNLRLKRVKFACSLYACAVKA